MTWCRPCLAAATSATRSRDADESSAEDTTSEDESSSSEGEEEEDEDEDDHLQREEVADSHPPSPSTDPWVEDAPARELTPDNATPPESRRPRRNPSARIVDSNGLMRFVPRAEAEAWTAALAATAGPGPRSTTSTCPAPQHSQGITLFERFFTNNHPPS